MSFTSRRDLALVVTARSVSFLGDEMATLALVLVLQSEGRGPSAVASLLVANALPMVVLAAPAGRLVDRLDNRHTLIVSSVLQAALCALLAFVSAPALVLALVGLLGAGQAVTAAAWSVTMATLAPPEELAHVVGRSQAGLTLAYLAAPALGGFLVGTFGRRVPLLIDAATFLGVCTAAVLLRARHMPAASDPAQRGRGGLAIVRRDPVLTAMFLLLSSFALICSIVNVAQVFFVRHTLGASPTWYGFTEAAFAVGMLAGSLGAGRLRELRQLAIALIGSTGLLAVGLVSMGTAPSVAWVLPFAVVAGSGNGVLNVAVSALMIRRADPAARGRISALLNGLVAGTQLIAFAAGAVLLNVLDPRAVFLLGGALALIVPAVLARRTMLAASDQPMSASGGDAADSAAVTTTTRAA